MQVVWLAYQRPINKRQGMLLGLFTTDAVAMNAVAPDAIWSHHRLGGWTTEYAGSRFTVYSRHVRTR